MYARESATGHRVVNCERPSERSRGQIMLILDGYEFRVCGAHTAGAKRRHEYLHIALINIPDLSRMYTAESLKLPTSERSPASAPACCF